MTTMNGESYTCPKCGRTSYNLNDVRQRYCGACKTFEDLTGASVMTKYQEYGIRISEVVARYPVRPDSKQHDGPMLDEEFAQFVEQQVQQEFGISWGDVKDSWD